MTGSEGADRTRRGVDRPQPVPYRAMPTIVIAWIAITAPAVAAVVCELRREHGTAQ